MKPAIEEEKHCENCGKPLFGRTDKRFCNDTCRNTFNREKTLRGHIKDHENLPEIFRIIKHNYTLLKSHGDRQLDENEYLYFPLKEITEAGFNFKYFTSIYQDGAELWRFCFERGWRIEGDFCYIRDIPEQANLI
jgi:predicted nucleic acid-binding Zn ribbon protein